MKDPRADTCPNCHRATALSVLDYKQVWPSFTNNLVVPEHACVYGVILGCMFCKLTMVEFHIYQDGRGPGTGIPPDEVRMVWPPRAARELEASVPESLRSLYREASTAEFAGARRGAAALYRATVEELCRDRGATGNDLFERINDLATKGIDQPIVDDLHEARILGNWSLHEGLEFSADEVGDVADLIQEAVHILYVQPAERKALREARAARRRAARASNPSS